MSDTVLLDTAEGVATLTLNRPQALNALTTELKDALVETVGRVAEDDSVRAVVLTGAGRAFSAGQDLREHAELLESGNPSPLNTVRQPPRPFAEYSTVASRRSPSGSRASQRTASEPPTRAPRRGATTRTVGGAERSTRSRCSSSANGAPA